MSDVAYEDEVNRTGIIPSDRNHPRNPADTAGGQGGMKSSVAVLNELDSPASDQLHRNMIGHYVRELDLQGPNLFFLLDRSLTGMATDYLNDLADPALGEGCPSLAYDPPVDTLQGIVACANGIMAAFSGKDIYFSEPWRPHAWPTKYSLAVDSDIVGLAAIGSSVAIMTKEVPYIAQGSTPDAMVLTRLEQNLPCVAAEGIVDLGYSVAYPSTEGIVVIDPNSGARMVSRNLFTREQWAALNPSSFIAGQHIGRYIVSYLGAGMNVREILIFDLSGEQPFLIRSTERTAAFFFEIGSGNLFFRFGDRWVMEWDRLDMPKKPMIWRSRLYNLPTLTNFGAILVEADGYAGPVAGNEVRVYADGVLRNTITSFNETQRLSSGFLARKWEIEVRGTLTITAISIAGTPEELTG